MRVRRGTNTDGSGSMDLLSEEAKLLRALIISLLYDQGDWLAERIIRKTVTLIIDLSGGKLGLHLGYLEREDLIEKERRQVGTARFDFYQITPRGIDVHEGTIDHPGVGERPE